MPAESAAGRSTSNGWQAFAEQNLKAWSSAGSQLAQTVAQSVLAGQTAMGRVIELTSEAMKAMAPEMNGVEKRQAALENYADQVRQFVLGLPASPAMAGDLVQLWHLYLQQIQELSQPWLRLLTKDAPGNQFWDAYEGTIGRLLGSPSLGYSRELNHRLAEGFDTWQAFVRAGSEYRMVMADAWMNAFKQTMTELSRRGEAGEPVTSVKQLIEVWTDTADQAFAQVFESKRYMDSQATFLNSSMALRRAQQEIVDNLLKGSYVPSRGEVDGAYRSIYELRQEVRQLKRQLRDLQASAPAGDRPARSSRSAPAPARRASKRRGK